MQEGKDNIMGAELEITSGYEKEKIIAEQKISDGETENIPVKLKSNERYTFYLSNVTVTGESSIELRV
ncbi:MAG: hypothetical protein IPI04_02770 [Ignavibacteria bacterium]|nr:hypothetical protein [Ignavibacteria bacterium]